MYTYKVFTEILRQRISKRIQKREKLLEKSWEHNASTYKIFMNFKLAYNSAIRTPLFCAMEDVGMAEKLD